MTPVVYVDANTEKIVQKYLQHCRQVLPDFAQAIEQVNLPFLVQEAHKIKGTGALMGLDELSAVGGQLEGAAKTQNVEEVRQQFNLLEQLLLSLTIAVKD